MLQVRVVQLVWGGAVGATSGRIVGKYADGCTAALDSPVYQVRGAWRVATSTNPNSMNKAARREYQALTKFRWFWGCCADVVLNRRPL